MSHQILFPISFHYHNSQFTYDGYFPSEINFRTVSVRVKFTVNYQKICHDIVFVSG